MTTMRFAIAAVGLALLAVGGGACNLIDFDSRNLQNQPDDMPPPMDTPAPESRTCPVVAEATPEYEAMCRHYCNELEATLTSLRNRVGVTVKKGALDAKDSGSGPAPKKS